jgi:hypothetical protein
MKILFIGNSQLSCVKLAYDKYGFNSAVHIIHFYIMPGGWGPSFIVENGFLKVNPIAALKEFPPSYSPDTVPLTKIDSYDLIFICALGHYDGGFKYINDSSFIAQGVVPELGLNSLDSRYSMVSKSCIFEMMNCFFMEYQFGFKFIQHLRSFYSGEILLQPFPLLSEIMLPNKDWLINKIYSNPIDAHLFFLSIKDRLIADFCKKFNISLLDYPVAEWRAAGFTPASYMSEIDGIHPTAEYGKMVLDQVEITVL